MKPKVGTVVTLLEHHRIRGDQFKKETVLFSGQTGKVVKNKMGGCSLIDFGSEGIYHVPQNILI